MNFKQRSFIVQVLIFCFYLPNISLAQIQDSTEFKQVFKLGINKAFNQQLFFGYERKVSKKITVNSQFGILKKAFYLETISGANVDGGIRTNKTPFSQFLTRRTKLDIGFQLNLEARIYPVEALENFFIGIKSGFQYVDFGNDLKVTKYTSLFGERLWTKNINTKQNTFIYGVSAGWNFTIKKKYFLEFYAFFGNRETKLTTNEIIEPDPAIQYGGYEEFLSGHLKPLSKSEVEIGMYLGFGN